MWRHSVLWLPLVVTLGCWTLTAAQDANSYFPPEITNPKEKKVEYVGNRKSITLQCSASGFPTPKYTWRYKGGNPLQPMDLPRTATFDEVTGALTVTDFTEREEGEYQCLAFSEIQPGKKITAVAPAYTLKIIVLDPWPVVAKTTTVKNTGEPVTLTCENPPRSQPEGSFKWFEKDKNTKEIPVNNRVYIDNKGNLHYSYVVATDTYEILRCAIFNVDMNSINMGSPRELQVIDGPLQESAPSILYFTKDATAMRNEDTEIECVFSGYTIPSVSWYDPNNRPITSNDKYLLSNNNRKLTIRRVQEDDQGQYTCRGSNSMGQPDQGIYLKVVSKPIPVQVFTVVTRPEFTNVMLPCKTRAAQGDSATISTPVWTKNGETFTADGVKYRYNSDKTELTIVNITKPADISCYRCETTNVHGDFSADGCLNVIMQESALSILYFTKDATAMRNEDTEMECDFSGYPIPSVSWFDPNNGSITSNDKYLLSNRNRKLTIRRVQEDDQGQYTCRGSNSMGQSDQGIYLKVVSKPIPVQVFYDDTKPEFTNVMLPCKTRAAQGDSATISTPVWTKNGETFTADGVKYRYNSDKTELTIVNITKPADISCYRCETTNVHGDFSADGCLNVINPIRLTEVPALEQRIKKGDTVHLTIRATTDVSMKSALKTRVTFNGTVYEYNRNQRPPFMTYDPLTQEAYIHTSGLSDVDFRKVNGTYTLEVYHTFENKSVNVLVLLEESEGNTWWIALVITILLLIIVIVVVCGIYWYRKMQERVKLIQDKDKFTFHRKQWKHRTGVLV